ncbi:MAG: hypothetical protein CMJ58_14205 [Planctomycetaceae bacterium]|nr:hypothetical protein [Planctomycetaceae bacterium]
MTDDERNQLRCLIAQTVREELQTQLQTLCIAVLAPICNTQAEMMKSLEMLIQGQALIERHLAVAFQQDDDNEPWRDSLD